MLASWCVFLFVLLTSDEMIRTEEINIIFQGRSDDVGSSITVSFTGPLLVNCLPSVIYGISTPGRLSAEVAFITSRNGNFLYENESA